MPRIGRVLLNISELRRVPIDPNDVYFLEAVGDHTLVRLRSNRRLRDSRRLGTLIKQFAPYGFLRAHRNHAVNLARIREIRRRKGGGRLGAQAQASGQSRPPDQPRADGEAVECIRPIEIGKLPSIAAREAPTDISLVGHDTIRWFC